MLTLLAGGVLGTAVGWLFARIPGLSSMHAMWLSMIIGLINPAASVAAVASSYIVSTFLGSAKEALTPMLSGDINAVAAGDPAAAVYLDTKDFAQNIFWGKFAGLVAGLMAGCFMWWLMPGSIGMLVAIALMAISTRRLGNKWVNLAFILVSQLFFWVAPIVGISQPIFALVTSFYMIPSCLGAHFTENIGYGTDKVSFKNEGTKGFFSAILSLVSPGMSPGFLVLSTAKKTNPAIQVAVAGASMFLEGFAISAALNGRTVHKAVLGIEVGEQNITTPLAIMLLVLAMLCQRWLPQTYTHYLAIVRNKRNFEMAKHISLVAAIGTCAVCAGWLSVVLIPVGLLLNSLIKETGTPGTVRSMLFAGALL
jgi:hypothetical protein